MKCGIMTFHRAINYGAVLQAYALRKYIVDEFDVECDVIDYRCDSIESMYNMEISLRNPASIIKKVLFFPKYKKFKNFLKNEIEIGDSIYKKDLQQKSGKYDIIISGSDQVWGKSRLGKDHSYFLDFVQESSKKVAYAASMGSGKIENENMALYKKLLESFRFISVREHEAKDTLSELLDRDVEETIDPTLLLNINDWENIISNKFQNKKYVLIYTLTNSDTVIEIAQKVAKERNLDIYYITDSFHNCKGIKNLRGLGPKEWVDAFINASYVVTNSFHGTAFSINFNVDFSVEISKGLESRGARIKDLLTMTGLQDRLISNSVNTNDIDFTEVNDIIEKQRQYAKEYLCNVLNQEKL